MHVAESISRMPREPPRKRKQPPAEPQTQQSTKQICVSAQKSLVLSQCEICPSTGLDTLDTPDPLTSSICGPLRQSSMPPREHGRDRSGTGCNQPRGRHKNPMDGKEREGKGRGAEGDWEGRQRGARHVPLQQRGNTVQSNHGPGPSLAAAGSKAGSSEIMAALVWSRRSQGSAPSYLWGPRISP